VDLEEFIMAWWWLLFITCWGGLFVALTVDIRRNYKAPRPWYVFIIWPTLVVAGLWRSSITDTPLAGSLRLASVVPVVVLVATLGRPTRLFSGKDFERPEAAHDDGTGSVDPVITKAEIAARQQRTKGFQWTVLTVGVVIIVVVGVIWPEVFGITS
jgi:hypothetical protein